MAKHSTPRRRSGKHWVGTLLTAGAVVTCMGLLLRFLPVGTIPTGGDEPSDSAVSSTEPAASSVPEPEPELKNFIRINKIRQKLFSIFATSFSYTNCINFE